MLLSVGDHAELADNERQPHDDAVVNPSANLKPSDVNLTSLQSVLQRVNDGPPSLPSICLYKLSNMHHGFVSR